MSRRHVALVIPTLAAIGGAERMVLELAAGLAERDWRVTVVALSGDAPEERRAWMTQREVGFLPLGMRKAWIDPRGWNIFRTWQRREQPEVLHGHLAHGAWFVRAARLLGAGRVVVVDTLHSTRVGGRWTSRLYRATNGLTDRVTAVSEAARRAAMETGVAREICVVANGVDLSRFAGGAGVGRERGEFVWLAVGRLATVKDYPRLLRAFALVCAEASVRLEIAGDGAEREALQAMAVELGIAERVRWHGFCEDVGGFYGGADGVVLASRWEGLPVCLMEAGAAGLPVVTTATAGAREVVVDGTGVLVDEDGGDALAKAMLHVMTMPEEDRRKMGDDARVNVLERFSKERMVGEYERVYREALRVNGAA